MRRRILASVAVVVLLVVSSCAAAPPPGPLGFGGTAVVQCAPVQPGGKILFGDVLTAPAGREVTVTGAELVGASGVTLDSSELMPIVGGDAIGSSEFPPLNPPAGWEQRADIEGATLAAGTDANLLMVLTRSGTEPGKLDAVRVDYTVDGKTYSKTGTTAYELNGAC